MESFSYDPNPAGRNPAEATWVRQGQPAGAPPASGWQGQPSGPIQAPGWQGQPSGTIPALGWQGQPAGAPQMPGWQGQPAGTGTPPPAPAWLAQHGEIPANMEATQLKQGHTWPALRFIARYLKVIAWIELVLGIIGALAGGSRIGGVVGLLLILGLLIAAVMGFIFTFASAEGILVVLAIEKNTRKSE